MDIWDQEYELLCSDAKAQAELWHTSEVWDGMDEPSVLAPDFDWWANTITSPEGVEVIQVWSSWDETEVSFTTLN